MDGSLLPGEVLVELMLQQVYVGGDAQEYGAGDVWQDSWRFQDSRIRKTPSSQSMSYLQSVIIDSHHLTLETKLPVHFLPQEM